MLSKITKLFLLSVIAIPPFIVSKSLFFPFITGKSYLFHLFVLIAFSLWMVLMAREPKYRPKLKNILVIAVSLLFIGLIIAGVSGVDPISSFFSNFERSAGIIQFGFWVLYFLMLISVLKTREDWQIFLSVFLIVGIFVSLGAWLHHKTQPRLSGTFGNPIYLAGFLLFAIGFATILLQEKTFLKRKFSYLKYLLYGLILFFFITLIFTETRGAYAGFGAGFALFSSLVFLFLRKEKKKLAIVSISVLTITLIFVGFIFINRESSFVRSHPLLKRATAVADIWKSESSKERLLTWQTAIEAFTNRPILGWGPENFQAAFNKHYNYRVGVVEPWFDRVHNQSLQYLVDGGILVFSLYLFLLFSAFYLVFKIFKKKRLLAITLASILLAYIIQGLFVFDVFVIYLGLFLLLAFIYFEYQSIYNPESEEWRRKEEVYKNKLLVNFVLTVVFLLSFFLLLETVWLPYRANSLALKYYAYLLNGKYEISQSFLEEALSINSPYSRFPIKKRAGWNFWSALKRLKQEDIKKNIKPLTKVYNLVTSELEEGIKSHPFDSQSYYILGEIYSSGYEKLGKQDALYKAETTFKKARNYSRYRIEYAEELSKILLLERKNKEAEDFIKNYVEDIKKTNPGDPFPYVVLGTFYVSDKKYDLAMNAYEKAKKGGYKLWKDPSIFMYYLQAASNLKDYQKIVDVCQERLDNAGPNATTFFDLAVAYLKLGNKQKAKESFNKALELNSKLEKYKKFFENQ